MHQESVLSSLSNMSLINNGISHGKCLDLLGKNFQPNFISEGYRKREDKQIDGHQLLLFSPMNNCSPKGNTWFLEKCWSNEDGNNQLINDQISFLDLQKAQNEELPKKKRIRKEKAGGEARRKNSELEKCEESSNTGNTSRSKNQTKNIPKNFGKAIITFIEKERDTIQPILDQYDICYETFLVELNEKKKMINTIANLRQLWVSDKNAECLRMISSQFLRKYSLNYIFNSRISNFNSHIKYRRRLLEAIECPNAFKHIKDY